MRILHVMRRFPVVTETFIFDLIDELVVGRDFQCGVLTYKGQKEKGGSKAEVYSSREIEKAYLSALERWFHRRITKQLPSAALSRFVRKHRFELVHCHFAWAYWQYAHLLFDACNCQLPLLISTHGSDIAAAFSEPRYGDILRSLVQKKRNVLFAATTPRMRDSLVGLGVPLERVRMIHNAASDFFLSCRRASSFRDGDVFRIANVGRLIKFKGHRYLIEAFARFRLEVYSNAELSIVGEGVLFEELQQLVENLGVGDAVKFLGKIGHSDIPLLFQHQHVYVQSSIIDPETRQEETFGVSILEAIAVGLPVIVTGTGGMPFLVGAENRFASIVNEKDSGAIFMALKAMFEGRVCNDDNIEYASERMAFFSRSNQVSQCVKVYKELLSL